MVGKAAVAVAVVTVALIGGAIFGYAYLLPSNQSSSSKSESHSAPSATQSAFSITQGSLEITGASLSNDSLSVTIQNTGSQAASLDTLLVTPGTGCSLTLNATTTFSASSTSGQANQTRPPPIGLPSCFAKGSVFLIQANDTVRPITAGQFNFTAFNSTSFSRTFSGNVSRTFSANFSRTFTANFTRTFSGNITRGFPGNLTSGFFGNLTGVTGLQLAGGQSVTLTYAGQIGTGLASGSEYTIMVAGSQDAQITILVA